MKRIVIAGLMFALLVAALPVLAGGPPGGGRGNSNRASQTLVCKDSSWSVVFPCGLPEDVSDPGAGSYGTGNAFGEIKYDTSSAGSNETMRLTLHGLQANTWYLVTFEDKNGANFTNATGVTCLFGIKNGSATGEYCDVALVKTNSAGNVNTLIPTVSGLTGGTCTPNGQNGCVALLQTTPDLGSGTYDGIGVAVKNVGVGIDGTTPDISKLIGGGTAELFEFDVLPAFTSP